MSDRNRFEQDRAARDTGWRRDDEDRRRGEEGGEARALNAGHDGDRGEHRPRRSAAMGGTSFGGGADVGYVGGGYGDQGGYGSQHGQGGYASPAQGSRYGQTGAEWGRSGYGSPGGERSGDSHGGGQSTGFGYPSYAAERDGHEQRSRGAPRDYGLGDRESLAPWGGRDASGEGGYGADPGRGRHGYSEGGDQPDPARRSQLRTDEARPAPAPGGRTGGWGGASAHDDDHEPHYRRWRDQQLETHDRDYDRWRTAQSKRYDEEYGRYRDQRHDSFSRDFGDWRDKSRQDHVPATSDAPNPAPQAPSPAGFATASSGSHAASPAPSGATGGGLTASDDSLRNVTDGGSGHRDHDKPDDAHKDQGKPPA